MIYILKLGHVSWVQLGSPKSAEFFFIFSFFHPLVSVKENKYIFGESLPKVAPSAVKENSTAEKPYFGDLKAHTLLCLSIVLLIWCSLFIFSVFGRRIIFSFVTKFCLLQKKNDVYKLLGHFDE